MYLCTDVKNDGFLKYFEKYNPVMCSGNLMEDFNILRSAKKLIMSLSTFSWWGAFLSEAEEIYMPDPDYGVWRRINNDINLRIDDENRYHFIPVTQSGTMF